MASRVVVVTGSSSGIGRAIAEKFAEHGDRLMLHGCRNLAGLAETVDCVQRMGAAVRCITTDLAVAENARRLVETAMAWHGRVDIWINAAGADVLTGSNRELDFEEKLERLWRVDVAGTIRLCRAIAARMLEQPPAPSMPLILNLSWDQAEAGMEGDSGQYFSAVKAAVAAFSKSLAKSFGPRLRVNCIAPGWIKTAWGDSASEHWQQRAVRESLLARWGRPEDIANAAWMLASPECEFINGQTLLVNGGR